MDITLLQARQGRAMCKRWLADGKIAGYDRARHLYVKTETVDNTLSALSAVLSRIEKNPAVCVVRGRFRGHDHAVSLDTLPDLETGEPIKVVEPTAKGPAYLRRGECFEDVPVQWLCHDIDKYKPDGIDPVADPVAAIDQFIAKHLPAEFQLAGYHWQLSNSAGAPGNEGTLKAHVYWCLTEPRTDAEINAWAFGTGVAEHVDITLFRRVQVHYTAAPMADAGVVIPVPVRSGLVHGLDGDEVRLVLTQGMIDAAASAQSADAGEPGDFADPGLKPGLVGAFNRTYPTIDDLLVQPWFEGVFERDGASSRRMTWLQGGGTRGGAWVRQGVDGGEKVGNSHATAPAGARLLNFYDLVRLHRFGHLDTEARAAMSDVERDMLEAGGVRDLPSSKAMVAFCKTLPEVVAEKKQADAVDAAVKSAAPAAPAGIPEKRGKEWHDRMIKAVHGALEHVGLSRAEVEAVMVPKNLDAAWLGCFFHPGQGKLFLLNRAGELIQHVNADWKRATIEAFDDFLDFDAVGIVARRLAGGDDSSEADRQKARKAISDAAWSAFFAKVKDYRQRVMLDYRTDMFASKASIALTEQTAAVTYAHKPFKVRGTPVPVGVSERVLAEYREHFPQLDETLDLLLHARFATDRRKAFLWLKCVSSWGKGFLLDGVLGDDGLRIVAAISTKEIEAAFEGKPVGIDASVMVGAWVMWVDELKSVKSELKQLNNSIMASPKNQLRFKADLFTKMFTSAEGVESLGSSSGVEAQFAERFSHYTVDTGRLEEREVFNEVGKLTYRRAVTEYAAARLNAGVAAMVALGRDGSANVADKWLDAWHETTGIHHEFGLLENSVEGIAGEIAGMVRDWASRMINEVAGTGYLDKTPSGVASLLAMHTRVVAGSTRKWRPEETLIVLRNPVALVKAWIHAYRDPSERILLSYKARQIADKMGLGKCSNKMRYYDDAGTETEGKFVLISMQTAEERKAWKERMGENTNIIKFPEKTPN
jgi:hypothetical protein